MALKTSLAWMAFAQGCALALQFGSSVVLAHYLTPYQMGIYAVAASTVGVLSIIQAFGLQSLIVREVALTPEITATAFTINALLALALSAAIFAMSFVGGAFLHDAGVRKVLLVLAISPLFGIFDFLPSANLERCGQFKTIALITTTSILVSTMVLICLAVLGFNYMSIAYSALVGAGVTTTAMNVAGRHHVRFDIGFTAWRRVADFGLQMLAVSGITSVAQRLSDVALGRLQGLSALGIYNRSTSLNNLLWNNIHLVIGRVVFVDFAELNRQGISLRERYMRTVAIITALLWPAFAGFALLSGPFIVAVYGQKWLPAARPLALLAIGSMIQVSITMTWELFAAKGELKAQTRIEFIRAILSLFLFVGGCLISLTAAAAARVADAVFAVFIYRPHLDRMTSTSLVDFIPIYIQSAILTALAIAPAGVVMLHFQMSAHAPLLLIGASVIAGLALWGGGLLALNHPVKQEVLATLRGFRRGSPNSAKAIDADVLGQADVLSAAESLTERS